MASVTLSFNLAPDVALGAATDDVNRDRAPDAAGDDHRRILGHGAAFQDSQRGMGLLLLITVFIIYIILGILYESFIHPDHDPHRAAVRGVRRAVRALSSRTSSSDVYGYVGIIMLIGIVKKNAIMMIDFAIERERSGARAARRRRSSRRRAFGSVPIMMTTVSAIAGTLPIAIGVGASAASRRPLGIAVVGGFAFSQVVTLYVTPVFYTYFDELQVWLGRVLGAKLRRSGADRGDCHRHRRTLSRRLTGDRVS